MSMHWKEQFAAVLFAALACLSTQNVMASDHDDGEMDLKGRSVNLTDLYVFREDWQTTGGSSNNLVFIMNTNPRSLPRQQYFFSSNARYEFHVSRVGKAASAKGNTPTGSDDVVIRFMFNGPDSNNHQSINVWSIANGTVNYTSTNNDGTAISTTNLTESTSHTSLKINTFTLGGATMKLFAGLREDPFFFDVQRYFQIRDALKNSNGTSIGSGFGSTTTAQDFTTGYNVNSIVLDLPISFLQSAGEDTFDVWETISVPAT